MNHSKNEALYWFVPAGVSEACNAKYHQFNDIQVFGQTLCWISSYTAVLIQGLQVSYWAKAVTAFSNLGVTARITGHIHACEGYCNVWPPRWILLQSLLQSFSYLKLRAICHCDAVNTLTYHILLQPSSYQFLDSCTPVSGAPETYTLLQLSLSYPCVGRGGICKQ